MSTPPHRAEQRSYLRVQGRLSLDTLPDVDVTSCLCPRCNTEAIQDAHITAAADNLNFAMKKHLVVD